MLFEIFSDVYKQVNKYLAQRQAKKEEEQKILEKKLEISFEHIDDKDFAEKATQIIRQAQKDCLTRYLDGIKTEPKPSPFVRFFSLFGIGSAKREVDKYQSFCDEKKTDFNSRYSGTFTEVKKDLVCEYEQRLLTTNIADEKRSVLVENFKVELDDKRKTFNTFNFENPKQAINLHASLEKKIPPNINKIPYYYAASPVILFRSPLKKSLPASVPRSPSLYASPRFSNS
jgi:hypothetical protein